MVRRAITSMTFRRTPRWAWFEEVVDHGFRDEWPGAQPSNLLLRGKSKVGMLRVVFVISLGSEVADSAPRS